MTETYPAEDLDWCRNLFRLMREGGVWGVPRSGLVFQKRGDALILTERMPHEPAMPIGTVTLRAFQDEDYETIKSRFEAAGIPVRRET